MKKSIFFIFNYILFFLILLDLNQYFATGGSREYLSLSILVLCTLIIFFQMSYNRIKNNNVNNFLLFFAIFLIYGGILTWYFNDSINIIDKFRRYLPSIIIFIAAYKGGNIFCKNKKINTLVYFVLLMISINSILIIGSVIFAIDYHILGTATVERAVGLYSNPNRAGYTSCIAQAFAFYLIIDKNKYNKILILFFYCINMLGVFFTFSKGAIILSLILLLKLLYSKSLLKKQQLYNFKYFRISIVIILVFISFNLNYIESFLSYDQSIRMEHLESLLKGNFNVKTTSHRMDLFFYAWDIIKDNWVFGMGIDEFKHFYSDRRVGTHNQFLVIWGDIGIVGLLAYLNFLFKWYKSTTMHTNYNFKSLSTNLLLIVILLGATSQTVMVNKSLLLVLGLFFAIENQCRLKKSPYMLYSQY